MTPHSEPLSGVAPDQQPDAEKSLRAGRPVWAEISASALRHNYAQLVKRAKRSKAGLICVIKADAYGHDAALCAQVLLEAGATWFAVTSVAEGVQLLHACREKGTRFDLGTDLDECRLLALSGVFSLEDAQHAVRYQLTPVLISRQQAEWMAQAAHREAAPAEKFRVHLEIDTGMARNGVRWNDTQEMDSIAEVLGPRSHCVVEAVMTHFSSPEDASSPQTQQQVQRFAQALAYLHARGIRPAVIHAGNSVTLFEASQTETLEEIAQMYGARLLVRPGIALYGYGVAGVALHPVLAWKTRIVSVRRLQAGDPISYSATFHTKRATVVATLAVGYADGYNRLLSNKGSVLIRGERCVVLGRVTMDQIMVDATEIEAVEAGEEVVLLGTQGELSMLASQIAVLTGTIPYEVLCAIQARVPRLLTT